MRIVETVLVGSEAMNAHSTINRRLSYMNVYRTVEAIGVSASVKKASGEETMDPRTRSREEVLELYANRKAGTEVEPR